VSSILLEDVIRLKGVAGIPLVFVTPVVVITTASLELSENRSESLTTFACMT
jgi:hypothetical protein